MIRRPPRYTRTDTLFPTRRSSDLHVLDMVAMFGLEGHSGFSASYARQYIDKALRFEPFSPLTGAESEWVEPYDWAGRSEEHTSELQSLMRISYAVFCLKKKKINRIY